MVASKGSNGPRQRRAISYAKRAVVKRISALAKRPDRPATEPRANGVRFSFGGQVVHLPRDLYWPAELTRSAFRGLLSRGEFPTAGALRAHFRALGFSDRKADATLRRAFRAWFDAGLSPTRVAGLLGVSDQQVQRLLHVLEIPKAKPRLARAARGAGVSKAQRARAEAQRVTVAERVALDRKAQELENALRSLS